MISHSAEHEDRGTAPLILINEPSSSHLHPSEKVTSRVTASPLEEAPSRKNDTGHRLSTDLTNNGHAVTSQAATHCQPQPEAVVSLPERFRPHRKLHSESLVVAGGGCRHADDSSVTEEAQAANNTLGCDKQCGDKNCCDCSCPGDMVIGGVRAECSGRLCACEASPHEVGEEADLDRDMGLAIQWLRHQMIQMKAQDKVLMRQFLGLRASIHGLRGVNRSPSSTMDLSATSRAVTSLHPPAGLPSASLPWLHTGEGLDHDRTQEVLMNPVLQRLRGDECEVEFRARTVSMVPARPRSKFQTRAFSKEFV